MGLIHKNQLSPMYNINPTYRHVLLFSEPASFVVRKDNPLIEVAKINILCCNRKYASCSDVLHRNQSIGRLWNPRKQNGRGRWGKTVHETPKSLALLWANEAANGNI